MSALMENKRTYNFETYAPQILGSTFQRVEILGYFPYETAIILFGELEPLHAEVMSTGNLPTGTPNDARQYNYYRIKKSDGTITMIGEVWIDPASIAESGIATAVVTIPNVSTADVVNLRLTLAQAGYKDFDIKFL